MRGGTPGGSQIGLEADRRCDEHRAEGAVALRRLRARGESIATIAKLAGVSEREVRAYLKAVPRMAARHPAAVTDDGTEGGPLRGCR